MAWFTSKNSNSTKVYNLGTGTSIDVSNYPNYKNFTEDNFIVEVSGGSFSASGSYGSAINNVSGSGSYTVTKTYDNATGKLTIGGLSGSAQIRNSTSTFGSCSGRTNIKAVYLIV